MPKIDAPTVAEHHRQRRAALIEAATALLAEQGVDAVTLAAVGSAAGLKRSSVYQYFDSTPALLAAVVTDVMPRAGGRLADAMARAATARGRLDAFVTVTLETATDPIHRSLSALEGPSLPPQCRAAVAELHTQQYRPLLDTLVELGVAEPELTLSLLLGTISAGSRAVLAGAPPNAVLALTLDLIHHGLDTTA